jgi:hypothetical protein
MGWWVAGWTVSRIDGVAARVDHGLSEVDRLLEGAESRLNAARAELDDIRTAAAAVAGENPDLPRVRAEVERLLGRLSPALDRADTAAVTLRSAAATLRTAAEIGDQFEADPATTDRVWASAGAVERGAELLAGVRTHVEELKSAGAVRLTRELVSLAREAVAGSERLSEGLAATRDAVEAVRRRAAAGRDWLVFRVRVAAAVNLLLWSWGGLG